MTVSLIVLAVMLTVVAALAVYRKIVARNEDDLVHLADGSECLIEKQKKTEHFLSLIDRAGITLTVVTAAYGISLAGIVLYAGLTRPSL